MLYKFIESDDVIHFHKSFYIVSYVISKSLCNHGARDMVSSWKYLLWLIPCEKSIQPAGRTDGDKTVF